MTILIGGNRSGYLFKSEITKLLKKRQFFILLINVLTAPFGSCIDNIEFHSVKLALFNSFLFNSYLPA